MATWEMAGNWTGIMTVRSEGTKWQKAREEAKERLELRSRQVGTDPSLVEKADILNVAVNMNIQEMFASGIEELDLNPISEAVIDIPELTSEAVTIKFRFSVAPEFEIGDLSSLKYEVQKAIVTNEDIDSEIAELRKSLEAQGEDIPESDDAFARGFGIEGVNTIDDLRASINDALLDKRRAQVETDAENKLLDDLCNLIDLIPPDGMVDMEADSMIAADKDKVASMNGEWEDFLKSARKSEEMLKEEYRPEASRNIKVRLILEKIAYENGLVPPNEEINAEYNNMAASYGVPVEDLRAAISEDDIIYQKKLLMAMDMLKKSIAII